MTKLEIYLSTEDLKDLAAEKAKALLNDNAEVSGVVDVDQHTSCIMNTCLGVWVTLKVQEKGDEENHE